MFVNYFVILEIFVKSMVFDVLFDDIGPGLIIRILILSMHPKDFNICKIEVPTMSAYSMFSYHDGYWTRVEEIDVYNGVYRQVIHYIIQYIGKLEAI